MEDSQKNKQQYLFQQIIQKNYDPEEFQDFITKSRPNGDDLENWSFEDLKIIVIKFQESRKKDQHQPNSLAEKRRTEVDMASKQLLDDYLEEDQTGMKSKIGDSSDYDMNSDNFSQIISCFQIKPSSIFNAQNVSATVTKFEKKQGGIFEQSYVSYFINTNFLNKTVQRRYSDFQWLKATLEWLHPGLPIPPIAKKGQFRRYDDKHLRKRLMILEMFLNKLLEIPELRADPVIQQFLALDDKSSFQKFKASYKPKGKTLAFKNVSNLKGSLISAGDKKTNNFIHWSKKHFEQVQPMVKTLYKDFKAAATALESTGSVLKGLGNTCQHLDRIERKFRKDMQINYCPNNFFTILSEGVNRLAQQLLNQALIFRTEFYSLLKYDSLYMLNILDSFEVLNSIGEKYREQRMSLLRKKEKLFSEGVMQKWELEKKVDKNNKNQVISAMLPKETKKLGRVRDIFGLYNFQLYEEVQRYMGSKNIVLGTKLQQCCKNETRLCSEMMMIWVDVETNILGMRENKSVLKC